MAAYYLITVTVIVVIIIILYYWQENQNAVDVLGFGIISVSCEATDGRSVDRYSRRHFSVGINPNL